MYNSQYYTCEEIDQRLLQNYLDDYNSQNNTSLTKAQFLQALYNMFNNGLTLGNIVQMAGSSTDKVMSQAVVTELIEAVANAINEGSLYLGILPPSANPGNHTTNVFALVKEVGTYTYFKDQNDQPIVISNEGVYIFNYNVGGDYWISTPLFQIDTKPTPNSTSLVRSGSILNSIIKDGSAFDLSAYNNGATYNSLSAALTAMNALPSAYKQGGMSIKYVSTSDNKYVQYRLMNQNWSTTITNWQGVDAELVYGNRNLIESSSVIKKYGGGLLNIDDRKIVHTPAGYYTGTVGNTIGYTENGSSAAYEPIDLSDFVGDKVEIYAANAVQDSNRVVALCNSSGVIGKRTVEDAIARSESKKVTWDIDDTYKYLYISGRAETNYQIFAECDYIFYTKGEADENLAEQAAQLTAGLTIASSDNNETGGKEIVQNNVTIASDIARQSDVYKYASNGGTTRNIGITADAHMFTLNFPLIQNHVYKLVFANVSSSAQYIIYDAADGVTQITSGNAYVSAEKTFTAGNSYDNIKLYFGSSTAAQNISVTLYDITESQIYATKSEVGTLSDGIDAIDRELNGINITESKSITGSTFEFIVNVPLKANIPAVFKITGDVVVGDGLLNLDIYDAQGRQVRKTIYINGNSVTYTPTADIVRVEFLRASTTGSGTVTASIAQVSQIDKDVATLYDKADVVQSEVTALDNTVNGIPTSTELTVDWVNGYYTGGSTTPTGTGFASGPIDVSAYRGKVIRVTRNVQSSTARYSYYTDKIGVQYACAEEHFNTPDGNGSYYGDIAIVPDANYLYISMAATATVRKVEVLDNSIGLVQSGKKVYVSPSGDDLNDGSETHPKKSITSALNVGNDIILAAGVYTESVDLDGFDYSKVSIKALPGTKAVIKLPTQILLNNGFEVKTSGYTNIYQTSVATNPFAGKTTARMYQEGVNDPHTEIDEMDRHPLQRGREYRCDATIIKNYREYCSSPVPSTKADILTLIDTLEGSQYGYYWEDGVMYFSRPSGTSGSTAIVIPVLGSYFVKATKDKFIELENIEVRYGNIHIENCTGVRLNNVSVLYPYINDSTGGFYCKNCTDVTIERCEAASATDGGTTGDGFNFHTTSAGGPTPYYLTAHLIDCWAHDNSDDGYSDHEYSEVTIDGGLFEFNGKGGITPSYGANDVIRNATSRYNISISRQTGNGIYVVGDPTLGRVKTSVVADGCVCYGNYFGLRSAQPECVLIARNCLVYGNSWGNYRASATEGKLILIGCKSGTGATTESGNVTTVTLS